MRILMVSNNPVESVSCPDSPEEGNDSVVVGESGYAVYINDLVFFLRMCGHQVFLLSWYESYNEHDPRRSIQSLYYSEIHRKTNDIGSTMDRILVHMPCPINSDFISKDVLDKMILVMHDIALIDPMYGMTQGRLRAKSEWTLASVRSVFHYREYHSYINNKRKLASIYAPSIPMLTIPTLEEWESIFHEGFKLMSACRRVVCPTPQMKELFEMFHETNACVLPHYNNVPDCEVLNDPSLREDCTRSIVSVSLAWNKIDICELLTTIRNHESVQFYIHATEWARLSLLNILFASGVPSNVTIRDALPHREFLRWVYNNKDTIICCLYPSIAFEAFGLTPYEMANFGIPTLVPHLSGSFTGLLEAKNHFAIPESWQEMLALGRVTVKKKLPSLSAYAKHLLD